MIPFCDRDSGAANPLTLILGQNGCGKTTIIECLKYITTGDSPPNSSNGSSFVHDPKMASESKVIGNVKLRLRAVNGKSYMISRSMEVTQKAKSISRYRKAQIITPCLITHPSYSHKISPAGFGHLLSKLLA